MQIQGYLAELSTGCSSLVKVSKYSIDTVLYRISDIHQIQRSSSNGHTAYEVALSIHNKSFKANPLQRTLYRGTHLGGYVALTLPRPRSKIP